MYANIITKVTIIMTVMISRAGEGEEAMEEVTDLPLLPHPGMAVGEGAGRRFSTKHINLFKNFFFRITCHHLKLQVETGTQAPAPSELEISPPVYEDVEDPRFKLSLLKTHFSSYFSPDLLK